MSTSRYPSNTGDVLEHEKDISLPKLATATSVGTAIEYYDFLAYAIAASIVFNEVFFSQADPVVGTLLAFTVFFVGFLARPIGAIVIGHFGDRIGRKKMLVLTILVMGSATVLIGLLPTYDQVGALAPITLLICRLLQGLAAGGEWGGAAVVAVEHAPMGRRGFYGSWSMLGIAAGALLAMLAFAALGIMNQEAFMSWGWRIPFLSSGVLVAVGLWIRLSITETREFQMVRQRSSVARLPIAALLRTSWRTVLLATGVSIGFNAFSYLIFTYTLAYGTQQLEIPRQTLLNASVVGLAMMLVAILIFGRLSDKIGRKPLMLCGGAFMALDTFLFFALLNTQQSGLIYLTITLAYVGAALLYGPLAAHFAEAFEGHVRYSGMSLCYQLGATLGGGLTPTVVTALYLSAGTTLAVSAYVGLLALGSVGCLLAMQDRSRQRLPLPELTATVAVPSGLPGGTADPAAAPPATKDS